MYFIYWKSSLVALKLVGTAWTQMGSFLTGEGHMRPKIFTRADGLPYVIAGKFMRFW